MGPIPSGRLKNLKDVDKSYIRPIMEYGDIVWSGAPTSLLAKLDHLVVEAVRLITGAPARSNIASLYREMGWQLLSTRREIHRLRMMYKISTGHNFYPIRALTINNNSLETIRQMVREPFQQITTNTKFV